jgi:CheY-like chemotaxis protein
LTVTDNGVGMDEATRQRIFEPFDTTKTPGCGTGLGLPMVQHIVKQSGGFLSIESAKGKGTTVRIYLPASQDSGPADNSQAEQSNIAPFADRRKQKRVLFVDDDAQVVMFASEVLRDAGYEVLVGEDGNVALSIAEKQPLELVITDLVMPGREGLETIIELKKSHPELPVIAISGAFGGHFLRSAALLGARATLTKPFSGEDLVNVVRMVLGG